MAGYQSKYLGKGHHDPKQGCIGKTYICHFGKRLYTSIKPIEWMNHLKGIQQHQGIYEQVNRVRAMCRDIYDFAKVTGRIDYNPLEGLQKFLQQGVKQNMSHVVNRSYQHY